MLILKIVGAKHYQYLFGPQFVAEARNRPYILPNAIVLFGEVLQLKTKIPTELVVPNGSFFSVKACFFFRTISIPLSRVGIEHKSTEIIEKIIGFVLSEFDQGHCKIFPAVSV